MPCCCLLSSIWVRILSIFISSAVEIACIKGRWFEALFCGELSKALELFSTTPSSPEWTLSGELILIESLNYFEFTYSCYLTCCWAEGAIANLFLALELFVVFRWLWARLWCSFLILSRRACCSAAFVPNCSAPFTELGPCAPLLNCVWRSSRNYYMIGVGAAR